MKLMFVLKRLSAFVVAVSLMLSTYAMPLFSVNVFADTEQNQSESVGSIDDVTNLHWVEGSSATLAWTASEYANYYSVTVNVYKPDSTTLIGTTETGTTSTELDVQAEIFKIVGKNPIDGQYDYDYVIVLVSVVAQKKEEDSLIAQSKGSVSSPHEYRLLSKNQIPTPYNLVLSDDLKLTFECDLENPSEVTKVCSAHCSIIDANNVEHGSVEFLEVSWQNKTGVIDYKKSILNACSYWCMTGKVQVYCCIQLLPCMDLNNVYETSENYYASSISDNSNLILYDSPCKALPIPTNLVLSEDLKISFDCDLDDYDNVVIDYVLCDIELEGFVEIQGWSAKPVIENGRYIVDISEEVTSTCRTFPVTKVVKIHSRVKLVSTDSRYVGTYSQASNSISYTPQLKQYKTPTNLVLSKDYVLTFNCNEYNAEGEDEFQCYLKIATLKGSEYRGVMYVYTTSVVDGVGQIDLSKDALKLINDYLPTEGGQFYCYIQHLSNTEEYATSECSAESNRIINAIPVESIKLSPSSPIVCLGHSYYLGKTITPLNAYYEKIEWSSDNKSVVTVDENGLIKGIAPGTANITAKIGEVSSTVPITVYTISSNVVNADENAEVVGTAGDIIDDIANNDNPDISNTDIDSGDVDSIRDDINEAVENGDTFHTDVIAIKQYYETYKTNWGQIQKATRELNVQFEGAYNIEVEMYHKDKDGNETHIGNITELDNEITFTFDLPTGMKEQQSGDTKKYVLVRVHKNSDGTMDYSPVNYTINDDGTFTTSSNLFSGFIWCSVETETPVSYRCNVGEVVNGTVTVSKREANAGETITVTAIPDACYILDTITVNGKVITNNIFTMPSENVTVTATFKVNQHILTQIDEKPAKCEEEGYEGYYKCTECNKLFSDAEGKNEISAPKVIKALGHKLKEIPKKAPTKTESGNIVYYECERCHKLFKDSEGKESITLEQTVIPAMTHDLTLVKAKAATCTEAGNIEYYKCEDPDCNCGKLYSDKYGQHEILAEDTIVPALKHDLKEIDAKAATCTEDGYEKHYKCSMCNKLFSDAEGKNEISEPVVVPKLGHNYEKVDAVKETYLKDGNIEYYICKKCGKKFADEEGKTELSDAEIIIPKKGAAELGETAEAEDFSFKVTNPATDGTGTVSLNGVADLTPNVSIPATVEIKEVTYKVTRIESNAFNGNKTISTLYIGANIEVIDSKAFYGCSNLTKVSGGAGLKSVGSYAFAKCPKLSSFKLSSKVLAKIGAYTFSGDKKLKTLYFKSTIKLTKSGVKKSLKGSKVKTVKVKKSKVKKYKKYFTKKNAGRKVKVKK